MEEEKHECFRCFKPVKWWGRDGVGIHAYKVPEPAGEGWYLNKTLDVCSDCLKKVVMRDFINETIRTRKKLDGKYPCSTFDLIPSRPCVKCHAKLQSDHVTLGVYDLRTGPLVDYCNRCYFKINMERAVRDTELAWPDFEKACQKWREENPPEMQNWDVGSD